MNLEEVVVVENEGLCRACGVEGMKKIVKEKEKSPQQGKLVQGEDVFRSSPMAIVGLAWLKREQNGQVKLKGDKLPKKPIGAIDKLEEKVKPFERTR